MKEIKIKENGKEVITKDDYLDYENDLYPLEVETEDFIIQIHREHFNDYRLFVFTKDGNTELLDVEFND